MKNRLIDTLKRYENVLKGISNSKAAEVSGWIKEVEFDNVVSRKLRNYIDKLMNYYMEKDREYGLYLGSLIDGGLY
jgi:hypothetical protein